MIDLDDVSRARERVGSYVHRTPLVRSRTLSDRLSTNVYLKLELFQKTGSFKPRGAFNQLLGLGEPPAGVVGFSGGNFAQGLAYAGRVLGIDTTVVMPIDFCKMIWVTLIAYLAFGEIPDLFTWIGGGIVFASTLYIAWRERSLSKSPAATPSALPSAE